MTGDGHELFGPLEPLPPRDRRTPTLVLFDVANDRRRAQVRDQLAIEGWWYQRSLWVLASGRHPAQVVRNLQPYLEGSDRLIGVRPCLRCQRATRWWPQEVSPWPQSATTV